MAAVDAFVSSMIAFVMELPTILFGLYIKLAFLSSLKLSTSLSDTTICDLYCSVGSDSSVAGRSVIIVGAFICPRFVGP